MSDESFQAALGMQFADPGLRHTASLIHAMEPQDRLWALSQLPPLTRAPVEVLLDELEAIGMPRQREVIDQVLTHAPVPAAAAAAGSPEARIEQWVRQHGPSALADRLTQEPAPLGARLLALRPWSWRAEVVRALPNPLRQDIASDLQRVVDVLDVGDARDEGQGAAPEEERLLRLWAAQLSGHGEALAAGEGVAAQTAAAAGPSAQRWLQRLTARWRKS